MPSTQPPNPALVFDLINGFHKTAAMRAAVELNLWAALGEGHSEIADLARCCGAKERGMRILCDYLSIVGLIEKEGNAYRHTPTSAAFLDPKSPHCIATIIRFLNDPRMMGPYDQLASIIREGAHDQGSVEPENPVWVEFAHSMAPMMAPMTAPLGKAVLDGRNGPIRVLDIAAGHGLFGIEVAKQNPLAEVVALDWAPVLEVARKNAERAGVASRLQLKPGSAFDVDFEGPYDIILLTNFLHHFDVPTCTNLLRKCGRALRPGGTAAALEFVPNPDRITPPQAAGFALIMLASTPNGDAYTYPEYQTMFGDAGFDRTQMRDVPQSPHRIILAYKPN